MSPRASNQEDFAERLAAATPTPGGGAAAARVGLYGISLLRMVSSLTLAKTTGPALGLEELRDIADQAALLAAEFRRLEKADIAAFEAYLEALRLPKATAEQKARRSEERRKAARNATEVPLATLQAVLATMDLVQRILTLALAPREGAPQESPDGERTTQPPRLRLRAESDLGGALELTHAAFRAAELNVKINLPALDASPDRQELTERYGQLLAQFEQGYPRLRHQILEWLEGN